MNIQNTPQAMIYTLNNSEENNNITIKYNQNDKSLAIEDNITKSVHTIVNHDKLIEIHTGAGNDIIHLSELKSNSNMPEIRLFTGDEADIVVGDLPQHGKVADDGDLHIEQDNIQQFYKQLEQIKTHNQNNRAPVGIVSKTLSNISKYIGNELRFPSQKAYTEFFETVSQGEISLALNELGASTTHFNMTADQQAEVKAKAQAGDILLRFKNGFPMDDLFVGDWQHAAMVMGDGKIIDAIGDGVNYRSIDSFTEADGVVLLRMKGATQKQTDKALQYALMQVGKAYGISFDNNETEQYCSGLIQKSLRYAEMIPSDFLYDELVKPDEIFQVPGLEVIWTNATEQVTKSQAR